MKVQWLICAAVLAMWASVAQGATPSFQGLGHFVGSYPGSFAYGISADGSVVVGTSYVDYSFNRVAFRWTHSSGMVSLGDLPGGAICATAFAASIDGSVIVGESVSGTYSTGMEAFRWTEVTGMVGLGTLGGNDSRAHAVSADGSVVVGRSYTLSEGAAFRWTATSGMSDIGNLGGVEGAPPAPYSCAYGVSADGSVVVGGSYSPSGFEAFTYSETTGMVGRGDLAGGDFHSYFRGVSADGRVAVGFSYSAFGGEAVRWTQDTGMVGLGSLAGGQFYGDALAVSGDGSVVVGVGRESSSSEYQAFMWDETHGMRNLQSVLVGYGLDLTGWTLSEAPGISADGLTIVGFGWNPDGNREAWMATLPEPATLSLLALGGLALIRRRRK